MEVVLSHDWLTGFRGGERVLEVFCEIFPKAPLYTLIYEPGSTSDIIEDRQIVTSPLQKISGITKSYRKFLPLFPWAIEQTKVQHQAKLMLSSSHCVIKGLKKPIGCTHISYLHSPMRYIYDQFENYFGSAPLVQKLGAHICRPYLQYWDYITNSNVDHFLANANFVQDRITNYYHKQSQVIHPFVDLKDFKEIQASPPMKEEFYLMVTAFAPNKRVDLAIEAFNRLGFELRIVGSGQDEGKLKTMAQENIKFLGHVSRQEIVGLMSKAKAFIFPGVEDFGITPLESLASGTPIIAYRAGGVLETLNSTVAHFFEGTQPEDLVDAVSTFSAEDYKTSDLFDRADQFSKENFRKKIEFFIETKLKET